MGVRAGSAAEAIECLTHGKLRYAAPQTCLKPCTPNASLLIKTLVWPPSDGICDILKGSRGGGGAGSLFCLGPVGNFFPRAMPAKGLT